MVVTRPKVSAARTAERLAALGHQPVLLPLSKAVHNPGAAIEALSEPHASLAITSAEAVRVLAAIQPMLILDLEKTVFAVGEATAAAARHLGYRNVREGSGAGSDLSALIGSHAFDSGRPLLYLAGTPRAPSFEEGLDHLAVPVRTVEVYAMAPIPYRPDEVSAALTRPPVEAVLLYSRETASRFFEVADACPDALLSARLLCISERTASAVPLAFRDHVRVAERPNEDALLSLLSF